MKPGNGCIQYHGPQPRFCGVLKIWWKLLVTWKELYAYNTLVHSHGFEHGLILGSPLSKNTTKPWLWTTVLYAFITWLHTNGFTNVSFLLKTFGYIPGFVDIKYIHYQNLPCFIPMVSPMSRRLHKTMAVDHGIVCIHYLASHQWIYHHFFTSMSMVHRHVYLCTLDHA